MEQTKTSIHTGGFLAECDRCKGLAGVRVTAVVLVEGGGVMVRSEGTVTPPPPPNQREKLKYNN